MSEIGAFCPPRRLLNRSTGRKQTVTNLDTDPLVTELCCELFACLHGARNSRSRCDKRLLFEEDSTVLGDWVQAPFETRPRLSVEGVRMANRVDLGAGRVQRCM